MRGDPGPDRLGRDVTACSWQGRDQVVLERLVQRPGSLTDGRAVPQRDAGGLCGEREKECEHIEGKIGGTTTTKTPVEPLRGIVDVPLRDRASRGAVWRAPAGHPFDQGIRLSLDTGQP